jgi:hypothetical protein
MEKTSNEYSKDSKETKTIGIDHTIVLKKP